MKVISTVQIKINRSVFLDFVHHLVSQNTLRLMLIQHRQKPTGVTKMFKSYQQDGRH